MCPHPSCPNCPERKSDNTSTLADGGQNRSHSSRFTDVSTSTDTDAKSHAGPQTDPERAAEAHTETETETETGPALLPPLTADEAYHPDKTGGVWIIDVARLNKPPEFVPDAVSLTNAIQQLEQPSSADLIRDRHTSVLDESPSPEAHHARVSRQRETEQTTTRSEAQTSTEPTDTSRNTQPIFSVAPEFADSQQSSTQHTDQSPSASRSSIVSRVTNTLTHLLQIHTLPHPRTWPRNAYIIIGLCSIGALLGTILNGIQGGVGVLVGSSGVSLIYIVITSPTQFVEPHASESDSDTEHSRLYNRLITGVLGIVLILIGGEFVFGLGII